MLYWINKIAAFNQTFKDNDFFNNGHHTSSIYKAHVLSEEGDSPMNILTIIQSLAYSYSIVLRILICLEIVKEKQKRYTQCTAINLFTTTRVCVNTIYCKSLDWD